MVEHYTRKLHALQAEIDDAKFINNHVFSDYSVDMLVAMWQRKELAKSYDTHGDMA